MTPPPGWYPDPRPPHQERWWDGTAWTEHRRAPAVTTAAVPRPAGGGSGRGRTAALAATGAVLVAAIVTGALVLGTGDDGTGTRTAPAPSASEPSEPAGQSSSPPATGDPSRVEDQLNGITFPLLDGWVRPKYVTEDDAVMTTDGTYDCPGDGGVCRHGLVLSRTVTANDEKSPEALAKGDIADAAEDAFDHDTLDREPYGGMVSHETVASGPVAVAGRAGYYVRWRVHTAKGPGGYVQSLVFPSSVGTESPVLVRYVFDAGGEGPPLADMDRITKGIRPIGDAGTGGGVGSSIGPPD
ncbi:DUF2510 domain-containing protein [Streptomyces sp. NPDC017943]|uniref:DUF2510 domain-containing protein n=1 Tax=Streptomyces sp. NPDC017943 TaxID=3365019 RepID=UPI0037A4B166